MTTIELERTTIEDTWEEEQHDHDHDKPPGHLYYNNFLGIGTGFAICGVSVQADWHAMMHPGRNGDWVKGMMNCPVCGTQICLDCILQAS